MKILIEYDSCWQTSFLNGDPNKPVSKKDNKRKFVATSKTLEKKDVSISKDTVMGVLNRLIGDQRKLYQARNSENFYFRDIENKITWHLHEDSLINTQELIYLTNKSEDRCGQDVWLGVLPDDTPWFFSTVASKIWSVLFLNREEILDFILGALPNMIDVDCKPTTLISRIDLIKNAKYPEGYPWKDKETELKELTAKCKKLTEDKKIFLLKSENISLKSGKNKDEYTKKIIEIDEQIRDIDFKIEKICKNVEFLDFYKKLDDVVNKLTSKFPENEYWHKGFLNPIRIYSAALYLQVERLIENGEKIDFALGKNNQIKIQGFSKRGFNGIRDWLNPLSGGRKKNVGTPCVINKQSGRLAINIDLDSEMVGKVNPGIARSKEIGFLIENAGVSAFYLGKKGLAYVSSIRV